MPIYEYVCAACSHHFEKLQKAGSAEKAPCPKCGSTDTTKQLSSFSPAAGASSTESCSTGGGGG